ncbi:MAG: thioredoxin domain-containing protein [Spirochaetota bacterium]|nr:thioredoxin domain-containing protein [Spirochaetota bacterium]
MNKIQTDAYKNHLIDEKSPYLLQHAYNPVNWYPWVDEAFQRAREEDKLIFLSIGYATCHWCHVMAHESFEDQEVANTLNERYISIKVDREERPDIDQVYMSICQALTGSGGWPLTIVMTPDSKPFFAATYIPKSDRMGMKGIINILKLISDLWKNDKNRVIKASEDIIEAVQSRSIINTKIVSVGHDTLRKGYEELSRNFDVNWGGFGGAPKFPTPHNLTFLLRWADRDKNSNALKIIEKTLKSMRYGGLFDQIGFGFHRYSVDAKWLTPHFEKMLYDQALLAIAYIEAYQRTKDQFYARVGREIFTYVLRDMTSSEGGFYSAEDADSEGEEGKFYIWKKDEIISKLGEEVGELFCQYYDITTEGNFENKLNIPHIEIEDIDFVKDKDIHIDKFRFNIEEARKNLFDIREKRIHPLKDDKILTAWNGLMIAAFAKGYKALGDQVYIDTAKKAADFILKNLRNPNGILFRRYREGEAAYSGYLNDYAFFIWGLIELYEATFDISYLEEALSINEVMINNFWDEEHGGFYFSGKANETLFIRTKEAQDGALPSGNSVATLNFLRLFRFTGNFKLENMADQLIQYFSNQISCYPIGFTHFLSALYYSVYPAVEIIIVGSPDDETAKKMIEIVRNKFLPNSITIFHNIDSDDKRILEISPFIKDMDLIDNRAAVYICEGYACKTPITDCDILKLEVDGLMSR